MYVYSSVGLLVSRLVSRSVGQSVDLFHFPFSYQSTCLLKASLLWAHMYVCSSVGWLVRRLVSQSVGRSVGQSVGLFHFPWSYQSTCVVWVFVNIRTWFRIEIIIENIKNRHKIPKLFRVFVNITFSPIQKPWGKPWHNNCSALIQNWLDFNLWTPKLCYSGKIDLCITMRNLLNKVVPVQK